MTNMDCCFFEVTFLVFQIQNFEVFSDKSKLYGFVMSRESVFDC